MSHLNSAVIFFPSSILKTLRTTFIVTEFYISVEYSPNSAILEQTKPIVETYPVATFAAASLQSYFTFSRQGSNAAPSGLYFVWTGIYIYFTSEEMRCWSDCPHCSYLLSGMESYLTHQISQQLHLFSALGSSQGCPSRPNSA